MSFDFIDAGLKLFNAFSGDKQRSPEAQADANVDYQREFAQNGVRWRVEDAKAAGVHPLFALGAQTHSFAPNSTFSSPGPAADLAGIGQDVSRSIDATRTKPERVDARLQALAIRRGELENDLLASQIARLNQQSNPPLPSPVERKSFDPIMTHPDTPYVEPASVTEMGHANTADGGLAPVMSEEIKQRTEDDFIAEAMWHLRNTVIPNIPYVGADALRARRPRSDPGRGYDWTWSRSTQQWKRTPHSYKGATGGPIPGPGQTYRY